MLNRRLLRAITLQALYSSHISEAANLSLAYDEITAAFQPDLNSMLPQNKTRLEGMRKMATIAFDELLKKKPSDPDDEPMPAEASRVASSVFEKIQKKNLEERGIILRRALSEAESIQYEYLMMLRLFLDVAHQSALEMEKKYRSAEEKLNFPSGLRDNKVVNLLGNLSEFETESIRRAVSWSSDMEIVRAVYRESLLKDETYTAYRGIKSHTLEEDIALAKHVILKVLFKSPLVLDFFEQKDLYWSDHADLVKDMLSKTVKILAKTGELTLVPYTESWEDDVLFVEEVFRKTNLDSRKLDEYLADQLQNWQTDRVALVDFLILKAALTEMIYFPGIPVKVTMNEYIEIAKRYSTPQSGKFINGILDVLSNKLRDEGVIKKSGRGLIDNK